MTTGVMIDGPRVPPASGEVPRGIVILLHGYGSNGADLISLAPIWRERLPGVLFVAPNAPEVCPGAPGGFQWWGLSGAGSSSRADGARRAAPILDAFIDAELAKAGLTEDRLALVGFSQGTMMALQVGPRRARCLAGIIGFSGMLADEAALATEAMTRPPILLVHGEADPMIPISAFYQTRDALKRYAFEVTSHVSAGLGHSIDGAGLNLGADFLATALG